VDGNLSQDIRFSTSQTAQKMKAFFLLDGRGTIVYVAPKVLNTFLF